MKTRRSFLAAVASGGVALSLASPEPAVAQASPSPAPTNSAAPPSAAAVAAAAGMRAFDPALSDTEIAAIAAGIDANRAGAQLNPKKKRLRNETGPDVHFAVTGDGA